MPLGAYCNSISGAKRLLLLPSTFEVVAIDAAFDAQEAAAFCAENGVKKVVQGNLDPMALFAPDAYILQATARIKAAFSDANVAHICSLGHGMLPQHDPQKLRLFLQCAKQKA